MGDSAFQTQFRTETIKGFEKRQSLARRLVTTEAVIKGNEATFLVADSGGATAVTRGLDGDIPTRPDNLNQYTATLQEWHDVPERTNFNIFASQGDGRRIMQETSMAVINRKIDDDIFTELATATVTWGSAALVTLALVLKSKAILGNASVLNDGQGNGVGALITPAYHAKLMEVPQFTSADYVSDKKFEGVGKDRAFAWLGCDWVVDEELPGVGTSDATNFMFHKASIGHAANTSGMDTKVGYDDKNDKSWARCSMYMGSKLLQNSGVIKMRHDDATVVG
ncbi:MAG: phage capsid protein [Pseudomonadota bacterium]